MSDCGGILWQFQIQQFDQADSGTHPTILSKPSLEFLELLEILRLLKIEEIITMVRRSVGGATPPSVMVLFKSIFC